MEKLGKVITNREISLGMKVSILKDRIEEYKERTGKSELSTYRLFGRGVFYTYSEKRTWDLDTFTIESSSECIMESYIITEEFNNIEDWEIKEALIKEDIILILKTIRKELRGI